jgi:transposase
VIDAPAQGRPCRLVVTKRALRCDTPACSRRSFTEATDALPARARVTERCQRAMGHAGRDRATAGVAAEYGVSWPTAWRAIRAAAQRALQTRRRRSAARIGIDETRFWWKEPWLTGIVDLAPGGDLLDIVVGRTGATVEAWIDGLSTEDQALVAVVVTDPHAGYRRAVADGLGHATQVVDRFHVAMLAGRVVTEVRQRRIREQQDRRGRKIDPGWRARRDLLRRRDNLTDRGWPRVVAAFQTDHDPDNEAGDVEGELLWVWAAKEYLADLYDTCVHVAHARRQLWWWYSFVADHPVPELVRLATTISAWEAEFLAYFETRATNGRVEGINRLIKHIKRLGYGFTNTDNYRLRILYRCRPLPCNLSQQQTPAA